MIHKWTCSIAVGKFYWET